MPILDHKKIAKTPLLAECLQALAKRLGGQVCITAHGLRYFEDLTTARDVRHAAGLSLQDVAKRAAGAVHHRYTTSAIACMEKPTEYRRNKNGSRRVRYPMPSEVVQVYQDALQDVVTRLTDGDMRLIFKVYNTGWRVVPEVKCRVCLEWYTPKRGNVSRCAWCTTHKQTKRRLVYDVRDRGGVL